MLIMYLKTDHKCFILHRTQINISSEPTVRRYTMVYP